MIKNVYLASKQLDRLFAYVSKMEGIVITNYGCPKESDTPQFIIVQYDTKILSLIAILDYFYRLTTTLSPAGEGEGAIFYDEADQESKVIINSFHQLLCRKLNVKKFYTIKYLSSLKVLSPDALPLVEDIIPLSEEEQMPFDLASLKKVLYTPVSDTKGKQALISDTSSAPKIGLYIDKKTGVPKYLSDIKSHAPEIIFDSPSYYTICHVNYLSNLAPHDEEKAEEAAKMNVSFKNLQTNHFITNTKEYEDIIAGDELIFIPLDKIPATPYEKYIFQFKSHVNTLITSDNNTIAKNKAILKTIFIPLAARISVSEKYPTLFYDKQALKLKDQINPIIFNNLGKDHQYLPYATRMLKVDNRLSPS